MCGIIGKAGTENVMPELLNGLEKLEYRGYDSAGIAIMNNSCISRCRESGKIINLKQKAESISDTLSGNIGIGHTRWATHGKPTTENAHPHISNNKKIALVHNGIIENAEEIKAKYLSKETIFESETDTEIAVKLIAEFYENDIIFAIKTACKEFSGTYALGILCDDYPDKIFAVAKGSPLLAIKGKNGCWISSDICAINENSGDVFRIANGEICEITKDYIRFYNADGERIEKFADNESFDSSLYNKGGYEHFMLKEIYEQPQAVKNTLFSFIDNEQINFGIKLSENFIKNDLNKIIITGCGSAYHTGLIAKHIIEALCKIPVVVEIASEFRYSEVFSDEKCLTVFISQSGETADTLAALRLSCKHKAKTLSIVNVKGSALAEESENVIYTKAGREVAVATTKAFSAQLVCLYALAIYIAEIKETITPQKREFLIKELVDLPEKINSTLLKTADKMKELSAKICKSTDIFFIGRLTDYGTACEGSLKMKEISYINSQSYAAGELKHGTISLIDNGTPVIAIGSNNKVFKKTASNISEVVARGAKVTLITDEAEKEVLPEVDDIIFVPATALEFQSSLNIIPLQLLSYYTAKLTGKDIDKPKNLAKSVTVE